MKGFFDDSDEDPSDGEIWVKTQTKYAIKTQVPAKTKAGSFPKHYSLDCKSNYTGSTVRDDGDGQPLTCTGGASSDDTDGANPNDFSMNFYHVCGSSECDGAKWAVYPPVAGPCVNVRCQPGHICCNDSGGDCGSVKYQECEEDKWSCDDCTKDPCGSDPGLDCPPIGLYNCYPDVTCNNARDEHGHSPPYGTLLIDCQCVDPQSECGSGYSIDYDDRVKKTGKHCKRHYDGSKRYKIEYKCSVYDSWFCGDSDDTNPKCPLNSSWDPPSDMHTCTGSAACEKWVTKQDIYGQDYQFCDQYEDPYDLYCDASFIGGDCDIPEPPGARGRGPSNKTKEKASQRTVCTP